MQFSSLDLSDPILKAIAEQGYDKPSPIQEKSIPAVLAGKDVMAAAQTCTGKTSGFTLPMLELLSKGNKPGANQARALVLTPKKRQNARIKALNDFKAGKARYWLRLILRQEGLI
jgi:ATP-dependent RNA helicase RhlE